MGKESLGRNIDTERLDGYPAFANFIAQDRNVSIFRKFATLDSRTLLYLQSELNELEEKLNAFDKQDVYGDVQARTSARSWDDFSRNAKEREHEKERMELVNTIRQKLTIYHETLLLSSQTLQLPSPAPRNLASIRIWTSDKIPILAGRDQNLFSDAEDLVGLGPRDEDRLQVFLEKYFGYLLKEPRDDLPHPSIYYIPERRMQRFSTVVSTILSIIFLAGAIGSLLAVAGRSLALRMGLLSLFTVLFAVIVGLLTNARRAEVFGSTAAYAAVLVVFVSSNLGSAAS